MAKESAKLIIKDYKEHGIDAGIMAANFQYAKQYKVERRHTNYGFGIANHRPVIYELDLLLWAEAQRGNGRLDAEWGLALYEWMHSKSIERKSNQFKDPVYYGPLVSCIFDSMVAVGKRGESHLLALKMENSLRQNGVEARTSELPELARWNENFPEIKMRQFPVKTGKQSSSLYKDGYFNFVYFQALLNIANQAYVEGDWRRAAELYLWIRIYTQNGIENKMTTYNHAMMEWKNLFSSASVGLSKILLDHEQHQSAISVLEDVIDKGYKSYGGLNLTEARILRASILSGLGECDAETIEQALENLNHLRENRFVSQGKLGSNAARITMILHENGRTEEAWEILEATRSKFGEYTPNALINIKLAEIRLLLREERFDEMGDLLHTSIESLRTTGMKIREAELYEIYAKLKIHEEDYLAAIHTQAEAARIYRAINREISLKKAVETLISYMTSYTETLNQSDLEASSGLSELNISLQPVRSETVVLSEQTAHSSFYLSNPYPKKVSGTLKLEGRCSDIIMLEGGRTLLVTVNPTQQHHEVLHEIELKPLSNVHIRLEAIENTKEGQLHLSWEDERGNSQSALWNYLVGNKEATKAFMSSSPLRDSPYLQTTINHNLRRPITSQEEGFSNIRLSASEECRIELYEKDTGKLIYVDANGDGNFDAPGDLISSDTNQDGLPDITWEEADTHKNLLYYYSLPHAKKLSSSSSRSVQFDIQTHERMHWKTQAHDVVKKQ